MPRFNSALMAAGSHSGVSLDHTLIKQLRDQQAVRRATAQPLANLSPAQRRRVDRLIERGIIRLATKDRYYVDEDALHEWNSRKRTIAFALSVIAAGVGMAWLLLTPQ
jgi:hypothetical protein